MNLTEKLLLGGIGFGLVLQDIICIVGIVGLKHVKAPIKIKLLQNGIMKKRKNKLFGTRLARKKIQLGASTAWKYAVGDYQYKFNVKMADDAQVGVIYGGLSREAIDGKS